MLGLEHWRALDASDAISMHPQDDVHMGRRASVTKMILRLTTIGLMLSIPIFTASSCSLGGSTCHGTPDECHGQLCETAIKYGCRKGPGCFGSPCEGCFDACASFDQVSCGQHAECSWDPRPTSCIGGSVNASCSGMDNESECKELSGCTWGTS